MFVVVNALQEDKPGAKWQKLFDKNWPLYQKWFLSEGYTARPGYLTCLEALEEHMPELIPTYEQLLELSGGGDLSARFLSLYNPPPYLSGCSQLAWTRDRVALIRNYDYAPALFDGIFMHTNWLKPVMAMVDCMWGVLDGMNSSGLTLSLSFGGRKVYGHGFGIPILLRYILETCDTVFEATEKLMRLPSHMQYNVTILDALGYYATAFMAPDRPTEIVYTPISTNHQHFVEWDQYALFSRTVERRQYLEQCLWNPSENYHSLIEKFLKPPLYSTEFRKGFGTLYTAVYHPIERKAELIWPHKRIVQQFDGFEEKKIVVNMGDDIMTKITL